MVGAWTAIFCTLAGVGYGVLNVIGLSLEIAIVWVLAFFFLVSLFFFGSREIERLARHDAVEEYGASAFRRCVCRVVRRFHGCFDGPRSSAKRLWHNKRSDIHRSGPSSVADCQRNV